ncbi:MAG: DMT family transporter [Gammaproteobacteria bacterium]|nr:DMT family transporter [Gammaproteobacteria bacterium]MBI5615787.1 DMT family transporter [Gammaproteobacteria bacterium]
MSTAVRHPAPVLCAAAYMGGTLLALALMAVGGRELSAALTPFQIILCRSMIGGAVISAILIRRGWRLVATGRPGLHAMRNVVHFLGGCGWFYGLAHLSLAEVFALEFTVPVWTALIAAVFLEERLTPARVTAVVCGIAGVLLILRPGVLAVSLASLAVLGGAIAYAVSYTFTKRITATDPPIAVLFYMSLTQIPLSLGPSLGHSFAPVLVLWPWVLVVGLTTLIAHLCITRALTLADASVVVPLDFLRLPLIALVGALRYGEAVDWWVLAGAATMVAGNVVSLHAERRAWRARAAEA